MRMLFTEIWQQETACMVILLSIMKMYNYDSYTCRIDINMIIKIADFGLSVNIGSRDYYRLTKYDKDHIKLPLKWVAPECIEDYLFSEMSDIVSDLITGFSYHCNIERYTY